MTSSIWVVADVRPDNNKSNVSNRKAMVKLRTKNLKIQG